MVARAYYTATFQLHWLDVQDRTHRHSV